MPQARLLPSLGGREPHFGALVATVRQISGLIWSKVALQNRFFHCAFVFYPVFPFPVLRPRRRGWSGAPLDVCRAEEGCLVHEMFPGSVRWDASLYDPGKCGLSRCAQFRTRTISGGRVACHCPKESGREFPETWALV